MRLATLLLRIPNNWIADLTSGFEIPGALIVNKWDINMEMTSVLEDEARGRGVACAGRVPYDEALARAMAEGTEAFEKLTSPARTAIADSFAEVLDVD